MRKNRFGAIVLSAALMLAVVGCGDTPSNSSQPPTEDYVNRYPGEYNTALADYDDIHVEDNGGNDISHIAIDLWYAANEIYNVDEMDMFEIGAHEVSLREYEVPQSNELLNYAAVVESVFTQNGVLQLEQTLIGYQRFPLIRKKDGKVYRMGGWKTGYSFANSLTDMQVKALSEDKVTLAVTYAIVDNEDNILERVTVDFTMANVDGIWLVDDYIYPEVYQE
ncbi:MAG TPA: hypothetical protein VN446_09715 [Candidatus Acidoferrum sp.]|nr:hypothetical protein [Candidatus Acidoferrum sp.]